MLPKYIWRVDAHYDGKQILSLFYDATSYERCQNIIFTLIFESTFLDTLLRIKSNSAMKALFSKYQASEILEKLTS